MAQRKVDQGLDFEAMRLGIERCDPDLVLGFYAEDARLSIVSASQRSAFELRGKAEIAKHLRVIFGQGASHRVEGNETTSKDRVKFREACDYPNGYRVLVQTTLEIRGGKIVNQVDVVAKESRAHRPTRSGEDGPSTDRLPHFERTTRMEESG